MTFHASRRIIPALLVAAASACASGATAGGGSGAAASCAADTAIYFEYQVSRPAERVSGPAPPALPSRYAAQFVVDTAGAAERPTFRVLDSGRPTPAAGGGQHWPAVTDSAIVSAAWAPVALARFRPAERGRCRVRMLVQEAAAVPPG